MANGKKTFIFYSDWINMVREMPNEDAGALLKHVLSYVNDEDPTTDNPFVKMAFGHMKPLLKEDLDKWEVIRGKRKEAGSKGGKASAKQKQANAKQVQPVNDNVNVNDIEINNIYSLYPSKCLVKNSSTGKSLKTNTEQIKRLLKTHTFENLKGIIERYVRECKKDQTYMKNFKTFLNNLPDYETESTEITEKKVYVPFTNLYDDE